MKKEKIFCEKKKKFMPYSVTIFQDGGLISGFYWARKTKKANIFLHDLKVADYSLLCDKCVLNNGIMYVQ
jgi:hypothetical protein